MEISCELSAPDTIHFTESAYVPGEFFLEVVVHNDGPTGVGHLNVYILQSGRMSLRSAQMRTIDTLAPWSSVELRGEAGFLLHVNAVRESGFDTLRIAVIGQEVQCACFVPVFVEKETRPKLQLICESVAALDFDPIRNEYVPDPFPVKTTLRNIGDASADDCVLNYTGSARVTPANGEYEIAVGRLGPGDEITHVWQMHPARRDNGVEEVLPFRAEGYGGLGNRFVDANCESTVFVPAARAAEYICSLEIDPVRYDETAKRYVPDPFTIRARVTNVGQGVAVGMTMLTILDDGLLLAPGQAVIDTLPEALGPGQSSGLFLKAVRPLWREPGDSLHIAVLFADVFGNTTRCETSVWIPAADAPGILLECSSERDSLTTDPAQGGYRESQFFFHAGVENLGSDPIFNVSLFAVADPEGILVIDPKTQEKLISTALLNSDGLRTVSWSVQTRPSSIDRTVHLRVFSFARSQSGYYIPLSHCDVPVFVPRVGQARLVCDITTSVTDGVSDRSVSFDTVHVDYEGIPSQFGDYTVFRATVKVTNTGDAAAPFVTAALLLPQGLRMEEGEQPTKTVIPPRLAVGEQGTASWLIRPMPVEQETAYSIKALASTEQVIPSQCELVLIVAERLDVVDISIPSDLIGISGNMLEVPVVIDPVSGSAPGAYRLLLRYDPTLLRFDAARHEGNLNPYNWRNLSTRIYRESPYTGKNILVVSDSTNFEPREPITGNVLVTLYFEVTHPAGKLGDPGYVVQSQMEFVRYPSTMEDGTSLVPFVRPYAKSRKLTAVFNDGAATLSGDCLLPLSAASRLFPNQPNPFNPVTIIPYYLAEATSFRIVLLDAFGRELRVIDEGWKSKGHYSALLDAGDLPSGLYFCRLEAGARVHVRKLLLAK